MRSVNFYYTTSFEYGGLFYPELLATDGDLDPTLVNVYDLFASPNGLALFVGKRGILSGDKSFRS